MQFTSFLKKNSVVIIAIIGVAVVWFFFAQKDKPVKKKTFAKPEKVTYGNSDAGKTTDSLAQFGMAANENFVVRPDAEVRRTPNLANFNTLYKLKFGTKVFTKNIDPESLVKADTDSLMQREIRDGFIAVYSTKPLTLSDIPVGYMAVEDIIEKSKFQDYKPVEKAPPLIIADDILSVIEKNLVIEGATYKLIDDTERFNNSLCYGDFNNDQSDDFAVMLDKADNSGSILLIYALQRRNKYELIYKKVHPLLTRIKTITKNTKVNVNYEITSFGIDGIHITNKDRATFFQVYEPRDKSFMVFKN